AAYKICDLVRKLVKLQAKVICVMTSSAKQFVTPLTLQTISMNPVMGDLFGEPSKLEINHVSLAQTADLILIAPATANIIGKLAGGLADDLLSSLVLAARVPILICPSMNKNMYRNEIVQENIKKLKEKRFIFAGPESGFLACGTKGEGRLLETDKIVDKVVEILKEGNRKKKDLEGKKILITAGPTHEYLDPVRFISNPSTGKMGYALAREARERGAEVILISGPTHLPFPEEVKVVSIKSAFEMEKEVKKHFSGVDVVIGAAAVSDWCVDKKAKKKIKKSEGIMLSLVKTADILAGLGTKKGNKILVGFAAETDHLQKNAKSKLIKKNLDFIVANKVKESFGKETNKITIIDRKNNIEEHPFMDKKKAAFFIINKVSSFLSLKQ
ncbi:bifunctional phosphopantothenoylcysteine decarboxylase/phosphopantothenate--cysteine ligase CoaBC, partial [bacterium]|nr:bifunctional phosphopantothenoylcysteine decarboxylase/phosphopantothenate--cysteine ligase CoaBC [bacterium]